MKGLETNELNEEARMSSTARAPKTCPAAPLPERRTPDVKEIHHLISHLFPDFLRLVEPDSAVQMDLQTCKILPDIDNVPNVIRAQVASRNGEEVTVIVAVEPDFLPAQQMATKIAGILIKSELTYGLPVLLSVIYLSGGRPGSHLESAPLSAFGDIECVRVFFTVWGLAESRAASYLSRPESLAWALAPYMRSPAQTLQELCDAARARINRAELSDDLRTALLRSLPDLRGTSDEEVA